MRSTGTRRRWWRRETPRAEHERPPGRVAPPGSSARPIARSHQRIREAETAVRTWVADLRGGFDVSSGATFDERIDGFGVDWYKQDSDEHDTYLSELGQRIADVKRAVADAQAALQQAEKDEGLAWQNFTEARVRLGGEPPSRTYGPTGEIDGNVSPSLSQPPSPPTPPETSPDSTHLPARTEARHARTRTLAAGGPNYREPDLLPGRSRLEPLMWLFVLGAVAGDIAAFYGVLARLFRTEPVFIVACAVGFAAAAIGICHYIGVGLQRRRSADRRRSDGLLWAKVVAWLTLGFLAFFARLHFGVEAPGTAGSATFGTTPATNVDRDLLAALTFAGLYIVSGLLAMTASFHAFNPAARAYWSALRKLKKAAQNVRSAQTQHAGQLERQKVADAEQTRAPERRLNAHRCTEADVVSLKHFARHQMAAELRDPEALELLMKDAPKVGNYPEPGRAL